MGLGPYTRHLERRPIASEGNITGLLRRKRTGGRHTAFLVGPPAQTKTSSTPTKTGMVYADLVAPDALPAFVVGKEVCDADHMQLSATP